MKEPRPISATDVSEFLLENPDFFKAHPDALNQLELPHQSGEAV